MTGDSGRQAENSGRATDESGPVTANLGPATAGSGPITGDSSAGIAIFYSAVRIAHRSGNSGLNRVFLRYSTPAEPPVPVFMPMVRWTILTWR
jgi:hypothetical protein